ncbi:hypothetical protein HQN87_19710 [Paenibacillus tritici]|uniref:Class IIb bacteriocin, lactobin A/cerein 7B family n=1 Tax=Paenibacillus tritici TaxID=1873425 RepID=A0ABX2DUQ4_9BACL|nr:daptide-type RiPP [Paenibacillus tritici]NQX47566.1 hypothetical protein [Paenibacillus tritici]
MKKELFIQSEELEQMEAPADWWVVVAAVTATAVTAATYAGSIIILT